MSDKISSITTDNLDAKQVAIQVFGTERIDPHTFLTRAELLAKLTEIPLMRALSIVVEMYNTQNGFILQTKSTQSLVTHNSDEKWPPENYVLQSCPGEVWVPTEDYKESDSSTMIGENSN